MCKTPVCDLSDHKLYRLVIHKQQFHHKEKAVGQDKLCNEVMDELIFFADDLFSSGYNSPKPTKHLNQKNGQEAIEASLFTFIYEPKQHGPFVQEKGKQVLHRLVYFYAWNHHEETEMCCLQRSTACCDGYAIEEKGPVFYFYLLNFRDRIHNDETNPQIFESVEYIPERNAVFI